MMQWQEQKLLQASQLNQFKMPMESKIGWHYTKYLLFFKIMLKFIYGKKKNYH